MWGTLQQHRKNGSTMTLREEKKTAKRSENLNMREIARQLGVSVASVARALNNQAGVSDEMRRRIQDFALEHGYTFHTHAMQSRPASVTDTHFIAFLLHQRDGGFTNDPFYPAILHGVEREAAALGHHVIVRSTTLLEEKQANQLPLFRDHLADAAIVAGPDIDQRLIADLCRLHLPCVLVDNFLENSSIDSVEADNISGSLAVTTHLIDHHYQDITMIHGPVSWASVRDRVFGYQQAMWAAHLTPQTLMMEHTTITDGEHAMERLLAEGKTPRAIVASNDSMALGAMRVARARGLRVPEDIAFSGYDDIPSSQLSDSPLTTVRIRTEQMGREAAKRLFALLDEQPGKQERAFTRTLLQNELVIRQSCGCPLKPGSI